MKIDLDKLCKAILENISSVLIAVKADGDILFISEVCSDLEGVGHLIRRPSSDEAIKITKNVLLEECQSTLMGIPRDNFEIYNKKSNVWYRCKNILIHDPDSDVHLAIISYFDITPRKRLEELFKSGQKLLVDAEDIAHLGSWVWNAHDNTVIWSEELYRIYGVTSEKYKPSWQSYLEKVHPKDRLETDRLLQQAFKSKSSFTHDERIMRPDGSTRYLHTWGQPVLSERGECLGLVGVCQDITEQKLLDEQLERSLSLLRATIESTKDGILVVDLTGKIVMCNKKFMELWQMPEEILLSREDERALNFVISQLKDPDQFIHKVRSLYEKPMLESFDIIEFKDGRMFERFSKPQVVGDKAVGRVWSFRDITARVNAEREAYSASLAKNQFLANMSHEIRTPLTAVLGLSDLLVSPNVSAADRMDWTAKIKSQGAQLLRIVDDVLDVSKIEFGRFQFEPTSVDISELVQEISQVFVQVARDKGIKFNSGIEGFIPSTIQSDPIRLKQILNNLIGNAIKFTANGNVNLTLYYENEKLIFLVTDTGIGIDPSQNDKLFEPFMQIDTSLTRKFGGTGLGLALAKKLAMAMGGTVRLVRSTHGEGSVFEASVATGNVNNITFISSFATKANIISHTPDSEVLPDIHDLKILVVEDSLDNQFIIKHFLEAAGATFIDTAKDGLAGYELAMAKDYDLVFMDIQMTKMDGYEATEKLRKSGFKKPIIALTAHAMKEELQRCFKVGCDFHLSKPIDHKAMIEVAARFGHAH